ncbi:formate dehydrogenase major subunit, partial [Candidatus Hakubella thermalkaliphila]
MEKDRKFRGREWEFETTQTICSLCGCDCDLLLDTMNNHIVRARPEKREGYLCVKGKFGWDYVLNDERLRTPLIRKNGSLTECSWKEALEYVAERLGEIKVTRGPDALGGLISASYNNETLYLFAKFV